MFIDNTYVIIKRGKKNYYVGKKKQKLGKNSDLFSIAIFTFYSKKALEKYDIIEYNKSMSKNSKECKSYHDKSEKQEKEL